MNTHRLLTITFLTVLISAFSVLAAPDQNTCPVMGGEINKEVFVDHNGERVYLCCEGCKVKFLEDPAAYVKKLKDSGVTLAKAPIVQTKCPMTGKDINKDIFADYNGKRIYFCGPGCAEKFKENPEKYCSKLSKEEACCGKSAAAAASCPQKKKACCSSKN